MADQIITIKGWDKELHTDAINGCLDMLDEPVKVQFYRRVWEMAGNPEGDADYGRNHIGDDLSKLETIFQEIYLGTFPEGPQRECVRDKIQQAVKHQTAVATLDTK